MRLGFFVFTEKCEVRALHVLPTLSVVTDAQLSGLREALRISPDNLPLRTMLAGALFDLARFDEALTEYREACRLAPADHPLRLRLAECYHALHNDPPALVILEELLDADELPTARLLLAKVALRLGDGKAAKRHYDRATTDDERLADGEFEAVLHRHLRESGLAQPVSFHAQNPEDEAFALADAEKPAVTFADVGGLESVKQEIALKVIHPLQNPAIYRAFGKKIGGGILLYGPPGCGKTFLARATAGEIAATFIPVGLNDVLDMWVGASEKNLHEIFQQARRSTPCVLFFDEIDALGASRTDMRQVAGRFLINQFLDELDGVRYSNDGILVLGATNCPWYLDTAFRRPGRFDRVVFVGPPDLAARAEILRLHLADKPTDGVDVDDLAKRTEGYSGADLRAVVDRAVEGKLPESLRLGRVLPITAADLRQAQRQQPPSTREWFSTAKNYALYANESGLYDDILRYLKLKA